MRESISHCIYEARLLPASKSLKKVLYVSNEKSKKQESRSYDGHGKKDFPYKIAWVQIASQSTNLLQKNHTDIALVEFHLLKRNKILN